MWPSLKIFVAVDVAMLSRVSPQNFFLRAEIPENVMECLVGDLCSAMYAPGEQVRTTRVKSEVAV